jgi:hypothetical protein
MESEGRSGDAAIAAAIAARSGDKAIASAVAGIEDGKGFRMNKGSDDVEIADKANFEGSDAMLHDSAERVRATGEKICSGSPAPTTSPTKRKRKVEGGGDEQARTSKRALDARTQATLKLLGEVPAIKGACELKVCA